MLKKIILVLIVLMLNIQIVNASAVWDGNGATGIDSILTSLGFGYLTNSTHICSGYTYCISKEGSNIIAVNGTTQNRDYTGTDIGAIVTSIESRHAFISTADTTTIKINTGQYTATTKLNITLSTVLIGDGYGTRITASTDLDDDLIYVYGNSGSASLIIDGFRLTGQISDVVGNAIYVRNNNLFNEPIIKNIWISDFPESGIAWYDSTAGPTLENIYIQNTKKSGIDIQNVHSVGSIKNTKVCNSNLTKTGGFVNYAALYIQNSKALVLDDLDLCGGYRYGLRIQESFDINANNVRPNLLDQYGIWVQNSNYTSIRGAKIGAIGQTENFTGNGIVITGSNWTMLDDNLIADTSTSYNPSWNLTESVWNLSIMDKGIQTFGINPNLTISNTMFSVDTPGFDEYTLSDSGNVSWISSTIPTTKPSFPRNGSYFLNQTSDTIDFYNKGNWYHVNVTIV